MSDELEATIDSLATKIEGLDLSDNECAVLDALLSAAGAPAGGDVEGYARRPGASTFALPDLRGRFSTGLITWGGDVATLLPSPGVVNTTKGTVDY